MKENKFNQAFIEEAMELLASIEKSILQLEKSSENKELINETFRYLHTIKGSGAMLGFTDISEVTHIIETVFDRIRKDELKINQNIITTSLNYCDSIKILLTSKNQKEKDLELQQLSKSLNNLNIVKTDTNKPEKKIIKAKNNKKKIFRIIFEPSSKIIQRAYDPGLILHLENMLFQQLLWRKNLIWEYNINMFLATQLRSGCLPHSYLFS